MKSIWRRFFLFKNDPDASESSFSLNAQDEKMSSLKNRKVVFVKAPENFPTAKITNISKPYSHVGLQSFRRGGSVFWLPWPEGLPWLAGLQPALATAACYATAGYLIETQSRAAALLSRCAPPPRCHILGGLAKTFGNYQRLNGQRWRNKILPHGFLSKTA